jgi:hypothetical protein
MSVACHPDLAAIWGVLTSPSTPPRLKNRYTPAMVEALTGEGTQRAAIEETAGMMQADRTPKAARAATKAGSEVAAEVAMSASDHMKRQAISTLQG